MAAWIACKHTIYVCDRVQTDQLRSAELVDQRHVALGCLLQKRLKLLQLIKRLLVLLLVLSRLKLYTPDSSNTAAMSELT